METQEQCKRAQRDRAVNHEHSRHQERSVTKDSEDGATRDRAEERQREVRDTQEAITVSHAREGSLLRVRPRAGPC